MCGHGKVSFIINRRLLGNLDRRDHIAICIIGFFYQSTLEEENLSKASREELTVAIGLSMAFTSL